MKAAKKIKPYIIKFIKELKPTNRDFVCLILFEKGGFHPTYHKRADLAERKGRKHKNISPQDTVYVFDIYANLTDFLDN